MQKTEIIKFRKKVLSWYLVHQRAFPWRDCNNPYYVLVSEFMLQQTQAQRVIEFFERFITSFPDIHALAGTTSAQVLKHWNGLGYNSRAIRLHNSAKIICNQYGGVVPERRIELKLLPGIGDYMSCSIPAFAYNKPEPVIDINIRRVLILEFNLAPDITNRALEDIALACIPRGKSAQWHNALMDFGAALPKNSKQLVPTQSKQTKFEGSFRQIRGKIVKLLSHQTHLLFDALHDVIADDRLNTALEALIREGIVHKKGSKYYL